MKSYGIYQLYVDETKKERNLLVGFASAKDEISAIDLFEKDGFRREYLTAVECDIEDFIKQHLLDAIKANVEELGVWAESSDEE
jgi:hypothetical protein